MCYTWSVSCAILSRIFSLFSTWGEHHIIVLQGVGHDLYISWVIHHRYARKNRVLADPLLQVCLESYAPCAIPGVCPGHLAVPPVGVGARVEGKGVCYGGRNPITHSGFLAILLTII